MDTKTVVFSILKKKRIRKHFGNFRGFFEKNISNLKLKILNVFEEPAPKIPILEIV